MTRLFNFDPNHYSSQYSDQGYVHIPNALTAEFRSTLSRRIDEYLQRKVLDQFALGNKTQALYEFPEEGDYYRQLVEGVGAVAGLHPDRLVVAERHIKAYDIDAEEKPMAHKDRYASQVSVGLSIRVPEGSRLVLYPHDHLDLNPFNSWAELRASLREEQHPDRVLPGSTRVEISDSPGDVVMFRGNSIWHLREKPAGTVMLYLKLNDFNCDPIAEDPFTEECRRRTEHLLALSDEQLASLVPLIGRRVDYVHRRYDRDWQETLGVVLSGESHITISEQEMKALRAVDGRTRVGDLVRVMDGGVAALDSIRRLARRGILDLVPEPLGK